MSEHAVDIDTVPPDFPAESPNPVPTELYPVADAITQISADFKAIIDNVPTDHRLGYGGIRMPLFQLDEHARLETEYVGQVGEERLIKLVLIASLDDWSIELGKDYMLRDYHLAVGGVPREREGQNQLEVLRDCPVRPHRIAEIVRSLKDGFLTHPHEPQAQQAS